MHPNDGRVMSNFIVQALSNKPITIYGDGLQSRSFCYVDDLINAFVSLMNSEDAFTGPVNIGNPDEFTILDLAHKIIEFTGSTAGLSYKPLPSDGPKQWQPDINLARTKLGWNPQINLEQGLIPTIEYFRKFLQQRGVLKSQRVKQDDSI